MNKAQMILVLIPLFVVTLLLSPAKAQALKALSDEGTFPMPHAERNESEEREASLGENRGEVPEGESEIWTYEGKAGDVLTIKAEADYPANEANPEQRSQAGLLDMLLIVYAPDGTILAKADDIQPGIVTDSMIEGLELPTDGTYQIEVLGLEKQGSGTYTLTLQAANATPADPTPIPDPDWPTLTIENQLEDTICYVYIWPTSSDEFGDEWLGTKKVILPADSHQWHVAPDSYNIAVSDCYGNTLDVTRQFDVTQPSTLTVSPSATDGPAAQCAEGVQLALDRKLVDAFAPLEAGFAAREHANFAYPDDEGKCALALGLIRDHRGNRSGALEVYQVALEIFQASGNLELEGTTINNIGRVYQNQGQYKLALEYYDQVLSIRRKRGNRAGEGKILNNIGAVYYAQAEHELALEHYDQALQISSEVGDQREEGITLGNIGALYYVQRQYELALKHYRQALQIHRENGHQVGEGITLGNIGDVYQNQGQYNLALEHYDQALQISRRISDDPSKGNILNKIGAVYRAQGQYNLALEHHDQALQISRDVENRTGEGNSFHNIGAVYYEQGQYELALEHYHQALQIRYEVIDRVNQGMTLNDIGQVYRARGQYELALEQFNQALQISREVGDSATEAGILNNMGSTYDHQGEYESGLEHYNQALSIFRKLGMSAGEASTLNNIGGVYRVQGQHELALEYYDQAFLIFRRIGRSADMGDTLNNIGLLYDNQGRYELALEHYDQALSIYREVGDRSGEGTALDNIGLVHYAQGQYKLALQHYHQSIEIMREVGDRANEAAVLNNIGQVYNNQGQYELALERNHQALEIVREVGNRAGEGKSINNIGGVHDNQGQYELALEHYNQALLIMREVGERAGEGRITNNIGQIYHRQGQYELALEQLNQAFEITRQVGDRTAEGTTLHSIGLVYQDQMRYESALKYYNQALDIRREVGDRINEGTTINNIGMVYHNQGQYELALEQFNQALDIRREVGDQVGEGTTLYNIGFTYEQQDQTEEALIHYEQAMDVFEEVRATAGSEQERASFIAQYAELYHRAVGLYHQQGQEEPAFLTGERGRARSFGDSLATGYVRLSDEELQELLRREREAYAKRRAVQDVLVRARAEDPPNEELVADLEAQFTAAEEEYSKVQADIEAREDELAGLVPGRRSVPTLDEVQALLDEQTTLISYWVLEDDDTLAFILTPDELKVVSLGVGSQDLTEQITDFSQSFSHPFLESVDAHQSEALQQLYQWLITPLKPHLKTPCVTIIPHGILHYLPFAALTDGESYFSDQYVLSTLPSASVLPSIQDNRKPDMGIESVLALGNPAYDPELAAQEGLTLSNLPFAKQEVETLTNLFGDQVEALFGEEATESRLKQTGQTNILHIAAHGIYNSQQPLNSKLFLAPDADADSDGVLEVGEVYGLQLTDATLVVLSACETGLRSLNKGDDESIITDGDEIVALNRAFLFAGTPSVLSTLWVVDDEATARLMGRFYTHLRDGMGKGEALRQAQIDVRKENPQYAHPYYWAGFTLVGDMGEVEPILDVTGEELDEEAGSGEELDEEEDVNAEEESEKVENSVQEVSPPDSTSGVDEASEPNRRWLWIIVAVLVFILLVVGGGWWMRRVRSKR